MIIIRYNNEENFIPVSFSRTENTVTLSFPRSEDEDGNTHVEAHAPNLSGFQTYRTNGQWLGDFSDYTTVYRVTDDSITYSNDGSVYEEPPVETEEEIRETEEEIKEEIRQRRETECFSVINRGKLWYDNLTLKQLDELDVWYKAWLDAPQTMEIPDRPSWLD